MRLLLVSGADGAPFARALAALLSPDDTLDVVVPTVRDHWTAGLRSCPDLDGFLTAGAGGATSGVSDTLAAIGYSPAWHRPDDATVAHAVVRTDLLSAGYSLTDATTAAATRLGLPHGLLPQSDDRAEMRVVVGADAPRAVPVAEYLADPAAHDVQEVVLVAETWAVSGAARDAFSAADVVVLGPSSRTLAIDPVLRTPGLSDLVPPDRPVLEVEHVDDAPAALVAIAGLGADRPGTRHAVGDDPSAVLSLAREVSAR